MANSWIQVAQEAIKIPNLLVEVYGDLAKPGVKQAGKALETVIGLGNTVLWPVQWANERSRIYLEKNLENYRAKLEDIPEEKVVSIAPEIGVPIAEKLTYVRDETLADLYVSLLATASNLDTVSTAHPSFVNIINNLSPDEARLLENFVFTDSIEFVTAHWDDGKSYQIAGDLLVSKPFLEKLVLPTHASAYFSNLAGLGLLSIHSGRTIHDSSAYPEIEAYWSNKFPVPSSLSETFKLKFVRGCIIRTTFGAQFIRACHNIHS